ncbi:hypothetical protein J6590_050166 [Homalodisca vitripennis]|nr:hypothetical protein J6590_050166 [Homalodisca vitripennis]
MVPLRLYDGTEPSMEEIGHGSQQVRGARTPLIGAPFSSPSCSLRRLGPCVLKPRPYKAPNPIFYADFCTTGFCVVLGYLVGTAISPGYNCDYRVAECLTAKHHITTLRMAPLSTASVSRLHIGYWQNRASEWGPGVYIVKVICV